MINPDLMLYLVRPMGLPGQRYVLSTSVAQAALDFKYQSGHHAASVEYLGLAEDIGGVHRLADEGWECPSDTHNLHHKSMSTPDGSDFFAIKIQSPKGVPFEKALAHIAGHWLGT